MAPREEAGERSCIVTREAGSPGDLIRFVRAPDGQVVPDLKGRLPGRGAWVTLRRDMVAKAVAKRLFARALKAEAVAAPDLPDLVDRLLGEAALGSLGLARKAGLVVTGGAKVATAIEKGTAAALVHASEAAEDGRRKLRQVAARRARETGRPAPAVFAGLFAGADLDLALGGSNVVHAAVLAGGASASFLKTAAALARYRGVTPETDGPTDARTGSLSDPENGRHDD